MGAGAVLPVLEEAFVVFRVVFLVEESLTLTVEIAVDDVVSAVVVVSEDSVTSSGLSASEDDTSSSESDITCGSETSVELITDAYDFGTKSY